MLYLTQDPTLSAVFSGTTQIYSAFTDLLVLCGRIISVFHGEELSAGTKALGKVGLSRCMLL